MAEHTFTVVTPEANFYPVPPAPDPAVGVCPGCGRCRCCGHPWPWYPAPFVHPGGVAPLTVGPQPYLVPTVPPAPITISATLGNAPATTVISAGLGDAPATTIIDAVPVRAPGQPICVFAEVDAAVDALQHPWPDPRCPPLTMSELLDS